MCISPRTLRDGTQVVCRECWRCRRARVDDVIGRCIAEMRTTPVGVHSVSLTYGRDRDESSVTYGEAEHERAVVLTYSDVQKLMKLLRVNGYPCRYLVVGEYGSRKGRAHWHAIFFWTKRVPPGIVFGQNWRWARYDEKTGQQAKGRYGEPAEFWPHGHTFWQQASYESFRYNLKYVLKDLSYEEFDRQAKKGQSKEPPLGTAYFDGLAKRYAEQGLAPQDGYYTFPEALRRSGERVRFRLGGRSEELFVLAYERWWKELNPGRHMPASEYVETMLDKLTPEPTWWELPVRGQRIPHPLEHQWRFKGDPVKARPGGPDCWGVFAARQRGLHVTSDEFVQDAKGDWWLPRPDGALLLWSIGKDGGGAWRDLKGESVAARHKAEFEQRAAAAARTAKPWLLEPLRVSRLRGNPGRPSTRQRRSSGQ